MPTSKLLYVTSDASCGEYPGNTLSDFTFRLPQDINLVGENKVLAVTFKGMYWPGKAKAAGGQNFVQLKMGFLDYQFTNDAYDHALIRLPYRKNACYIEASQSRPVCIDVQSISEIKILICNEKGNAYKFAGAVNEPTVIKLEISSMDATRRAFTVACDAASSGCGSFTTRLPLELHLKGRYKVALTNTIIPGDVMAGVNTPSITIEAGRVVNSITNQPGQAPAVDTVEQLTIDIQAENVPNIPQLILALNHFLISERIGIFISISGKKSREIRFKIQPLATSIAAMASSNMTDAKWKKMVKNRRQTLHDDEEYMDIDLIPFQGGGGLTLDRQHFHWAQVTINDSLMHILSGEMKQHNFFLNFARAGVSDVHALKCTNMPSMDRARPSALAIHTPLVTETVFADHQEHLLQIIPANKQSAGERNAKKTLLYTPDNITYQDLTMDLIREIPIKITDLRGRMVRQAYNLQFIIILHFIPV